VVAAYYAAVGLDFDEFVRDARRFRGRHLLAHGLNVHLGYRFAHRLASRCGVIPERLRQLDSARFDRLHHGVRRLGIVCHDIRSRRPCYFATGIEHGITVADAVRASASIPYLFPAVSVTCDGETRRLTDGGVSDALPLSFARSAAIAATHVVVSDCRWIGRVHATDQKTVWIRPRMISTGSLWSPAHGLASAVRDGELAVTPEALHRVESWFHHRAPAAATA
jgi:predicted acylesterase/phospholipase RssA